MNENRRRLISLSVATCFLFGISLWQLGDSPFLEYGLLLGFVLMLGWIGVLFVLWLYMKTEEKERRKNESQDEV